MRQEKKDIRVSWIMQDLDNGVTWLEKDNMGFGSIQKLYGINEMQVEAIRKHPKLIGLEPRVTIINLIDDTTETTSAPTTSNELDPIGEYVSAFNNL